MEDIKQFEPLWESWYVKDIIGEGGFGKVYRIERSEFGITYNAALKHIRVPQSDAEIKSIKEDGLTDAEIDEYFESVVKDIISEFVLMSKLKGDSHIVSYEDHKVVKNENGFGWNIFIRMELLTSLFDYIHQNELTKKTVIKLGIDICKALERCQMYNIIHRDIKPENIFVSETGAFKLGDFGIARQIEKTASGLSKKGTFSYIAPEVYKGEAYGSTVDIYSLGLVMYRLLNNNRVPFMPPYPTPIKYMDRELALGRRMKGEVIPPPVNADGRLAEIVLKACAYNPKDRYDSPSVMRRALEDILYTEEQTRDIYPEGDNVELNSVHYISTEQSTQPPKPQISSPETDETMAMPADISKVEDDETQALPKTESHLPLKNENVYNILDRLEEIEPKDSNLHAGIYKVSDFKNGIYKPDNIKKPNDVGRKVGIYKIGDLEQQDNIARKARANENDSTYRYSYHQYNEKDEIAVKAKIWGLCFILFVFCIITAFLSTFLDFNSIVITEFSIVIASVCAGGVANLCSKIDMPDFATGTIVILTWLLVLSIGVSTVTW